MRQQAATKISDIALVGPGSDHTLVDLDPLTVRWKSEGESQRVQAYLENVLDGSRSRAYAADSTDRVVTFCPDDYKSLRTNRERGGHNTIRVILEAAKQIFRSEKFDLFVGTQLLLVADQKKATLAAMIDNGLVQGYTYDAQVVLPQKKSLTPVVFGGTITSKKDWLLKKPDSVDWPSIKIVFLAPEADRSTVRPTYLVDQSLGVPPSQAEVQCGP